jgi:hypothetical protein
MVIAEEIELEAPRVSGPSVIQIPQMVDALRLEERRIFERIFDVQTSTGRLIPPDPMKHWIEHQFGSVEAVLEQPIVKITNQVTMEGVLFNWLRSNRPIWRDSKLDLEAELAAEDQDPLEDVYNQTPEDVFGRVEGEYCVTASNIAKFDGYHGLIVFKEEHPLRFGREQVKDYIQTGWAWAARVNDIDADARYYMFLWNCLWRAGASLLHGHAQMVLGKGLHYAAVERLRRNAMFYGARFRSDYFEDFFLAHRMVGCAFQRDDVRVIANLAPLKENEVILMAWHGEGGLLDRLYETLAVFRDRLGVLSFNVVMYQPPLRETEEDWDDFPIIVRIVDRGDPATRTADFGAMELYAASVVSSDPLRLAAILRDSLGGTEIS